LGGWGDLISPNLSADFTQFAYLVNDFIISYA
jgi:hypothetical protein